MNFDILGSKFTIDDKIELDIKRRVNARNKENAYIKHKHPSKITRKMCIIKFLF